MTTQSTKLSQWLHAYGPLRLTLITAVIVDMILRPEPGVHLSYEGLLIVPNLLAPVLAPIFFMLLLLDMIMSLVYRSDKDEATRARYLIIAMTMLGMAVILLAYWMPFFSKLSSTL